MATKKSNGKKTRPIALFLPDDIKAALEARCAAELKSTGVKISKQQLILGVLRKAMPAK